MQSSYSSSTSLDEKLKSSARNPISLRLYKVFGTNYDDPAIREALETVSELYKAPESTKGKGVEREAKSLAEEDDVSVFDLESKLVGRHALTSSGTAARARKNLRRDAELKLARGSRQFVHAFQQVDKHLDVLQEHIDAMHVRCDEAQEQLRSTNEACRSLLERAGGLRATRHAVNEQQTAVDAFLSHFTLTEEESDLLQSRNIQIDSIFFRAMQKAERIIADSSVLMSGQDGPTKAGVEIIAATSRQLEEGYDKLTRWCSLEFRQFVRDALLEVTSLLIEAVRWLRKKPELLSEALSVLSQTRQSTLLNSFMDALTRGGPGGLPRPIEIHAHDPLRYVGDMLAWVHQTIAGEREFLESLFGVKGERRMVGSVRKFEDSEEEGWIQELMDNSLEKLRYPLKVRVRQTVRSQESCIASYKVANLLTFYNLTMRRTVGEKAGLSETLNEITDEAYKVFMDTVEAQARSLARTILPDDQDAQPPISLLDHTQVLRELMNVYKSSLMGDESPNDLREGFRPILDVMVDAAINMCLSVSDARATQKGDWDGDAFVMNCLTHLLSVVRPYTFADYKASELQNDIDARAELLITDHFDSVLRDTSLSECISTCNAQSSSDSNPDAEPREPLSHIGAMQPQELALALRAFASWLTSPDVVHPPRLAPLLDRRLAERVHRAALRALVGAYERLCTEVRRPENRYEAANTILGAQRPFGSLPALRQILGVEEDG
ncbi:COG6 [Sanghuangporus vaninii]